MATGTLPEHPDRPKQHKFLSVDFVTALSKDECCIRLESGPHVAGQTVTLNERDSFTIQATAADQPRVEVRFWGTLQSVRRGTWVWGTVIETREAYRRNTTWLAFGMVILLALMIEAGLRQSTRDTLIFGGLLLAAGTLRVIYWRIRHRHGLRVVRWVWETLYVTPERETAARPE